MKVETVYPTLFRPIVITLETEEEALVLWHRLNASDGQFAEYYKTSGYTQNERLDGIAAVMWSKINKLFQIKPDRN